MKILEIIIGVYKIINIITGKYYIGYAKDIYKRFKKHRNTLKNGNHLNIMLQRSYNKYTLEAFNFEILHQYDNIEDAKNKEYKLQQDKNRKEYKKQQPTKAQHRNGIFYIDTIYNFLLLERNQRIL